MTYKELISRLYDLRRLSDKITPENSERSGCMSSFDRNSFYDEETDTYHNWDANDDGTGCIRKNSDGSIVAFEMEGPGVIWRVWSALPQTGHMKVFIDGKETPDIDLPFIDWFEKNGDEMPPLNYSELSLRLSRGRNCFIPIPFQKCCKVVLEKGWGMYYHFTYTRFANGTVVPSYKERFTTSGELLLAKADALMYDRGENQTLPEGSKEICKKADIAPGKKANVYSTSKSGAIAELAFMPSCLRDKKAAENLVMRLYWDGDEKCSVEAPINEFFGGADGYSHFRTLPVSMEKYAYTCRFYMPFSTGCRLEVENLSNENQTVEFKLTVEDISKAEADEKLRFHALYHGNMDDGNPRFAPGGDRWPDWCMLRVKNTRGRFVGVHLHIYDYWQDKENTEGEHFYGKWDKKSVDWWWGEGDEKFFVDGEKFPSTFGTGSEDYIGYAWAAEPPFARFDSPYATLSTMPLNGRGHTGVSRFQIPDCVPFTDSFEAYIEKYKGDQWTDECPQGGKELEDLDGEKNSCTFTAVPYWYEEK